ncbi:hypothetical protein JNK62_01845 [bacterium]|nr:hypothetical protein [bacterium]
MKYIDRHTAIKMIATAAAVDAAQGALTASYVGILFAPLLSAGAAYGFWKWFARHEGESPDPRKNPRLMTIALEFIPGLDALPLWTITIILAVIAHNRASREV